MRFPGIELFKPYYYQGQFLASDAKVRLVGGSNRGAKSLICAYDTALMATGTHPRRQWWKPPLKVYILRNSYTDIGLYIYPMLFESAYMLEDGTPAPPLIPTPCVVLLWPQMRSRTSLMPMATT